MVPVDTFDVSKHVSHGAADKQLAASGPEKVLVS